MADDCNNRSCVALGLAYCVACRTSFLRWKAGYIFNMPELAEVERARRRVERAILGKRVTKCVAVEQGGGPRSGQFDGLVVKPLRATYAKTTKAVLCPR